MPTPISLPGFEGRTLTIEPSAWSGRSKVMLDGVEVKATSQTPATFTSAPLSAPDSKAVSRGGNGKNEFLLRRNDGREVLVRVRSAFPDPAPILEMDGQTIRTARKLTVFEWIWAGFPLVLLVLGGAIGGGVGMVAAISNINIIRDESKGILRYVICAVLTTFSFMAYFLLASAFRALIKR